MMEMKNVHVEQLAAVLNALGEVKHPMLAFHVAMMQQKVSPVLQALQKARTQGEEFQEYTRKRISLCELYAKKDEAGNPIKERVQVTSQGGWQDNYKIEDPEFAEKAAKLEAENAAVLQAEALRQQAVVELLTSPSDLEFGTKIKYSWCKDHLTGNNLALLMACNVLELDETPEGTPIVEGVPAIAAVADDTEE